MRSDAETTRLVRSWLEDGRSRLPDHVLDAVLGQLPATPQRRSAWPARRIADVNAYAKLLVAAAAVIAVVVVGLNLVPANGGVGVGPAATPSPSPSPSSTPSPKPNAVLTPYAEIQPGTRYALSLPESDVRMSLVLSTDGWSYDGLWFNRRVGPDQEIELAFGGSSTEARAIFTDPCAHTGRQDFAATTAGAASALAALDGVEVIDPPSVTIVGGRTATSVAISVPTDVGCANTDYWVWYGPPDLGHPTEYPSWLDSNFQYWFVDLGTGRYLNIKAETRQQDRTSPVREEIEHIIDSIQFE